MIRFIKTIFTFIVLAVVTVVAHNNLNLSFPVVYAKTEIEKLKEQIDTRSLRLQEIDEEIKQFEANLKKVGAKKKTLQNAIRKLELERKKISTEIKKTEEMIGFTDLEISKLKIEIDKTKDNISKIKKSISEMVRKDYAGESQTVIEIMLNNDRLSNFWTTYELQSNIKKNLSYKINELDSFKLLLEEKLHINKTKLDNLSNLKKQYSDQNKVLTNNKLEKTTLLSKTKNKESEYQKLLRKKRAARDKLFKEMREFESKLKFILDPKTIPTEGSGVLSWPLDNYTITQLFGGTEFAKRNAAAYGGRPYHSGMDLAAPRGTPIKAALSGVVRAVGNTDAVPGCYSWGKWTLIDHPNGLSTLYAHQDVLGVSAGQKVQTGEVIGYVGSTGFSTGNHLHFTVYAQKGVKVRKFNEIKTVTSCGPATTPVAATDAYLDPMLYLTPR